MRLQRVALIVSKCFVSCDSFGCFASHGGSVAATWHPAARPGAIGSPRVWAEGVPVAEVRVSAETVPKSESLESSSKK